MRVTTIVFGGDGDPHSPDAVRAPDIAAARDLAARAAPGLAWLVASGAGVSEATLAALRPHGPAPAASLVVDERGQPVQTLLGRLLDDKAGLVAAAARRSVPLRHVPVVSLLVDCALVAELPGPDIGRFGTYAGSEWTARLFARSPGVLACTSVAVMAARARPPLHDLARMARSGVWRRAELPGEVYRAVAGR